MVTRNLSAVTWLVTKCKSRYCVTLNSEGFQLSFALLLALLPCQNKVYVSIVM